MGHSIESRLDRGVVGEEDSYIVSEMIAALKMMRDAFWGTSHNEIEDEANAYAARVLSELEAMDAFADDDGDELDFGGYQ